MWRGYSATRRVLKFQRDWRQGWQDIGECWKLLTLDKIGRCVLLSLNALSKNPETLWVCRGHVEVPCGKKIAGIEQDLEEI